MNYTESIIEKIIIERNKSADSAVIMEIKKIATENSIETKFILNEKNIIEALKKQVPQKPVNTKNEIVCPTCSTLVGSRPYCGYCGQKLDHTEKGGE